MPWRPEDARRHTKKADTFELCELWSEVANKVLEETGDEGRAVRTANAVVARISGESRRRTPAIAPSSAARAPQERSGRRAGCASEGERSVPG